MPVTRLLYLKAGITACHFLAMIASGIHYFIYSVGIVNVSFIIVNAPGGKYKNLRHIWFTRFLKRIVSALLRTPLREDVTKLLTVDFYNNVPQNAVIVCCHTPWARLIASWCNEHNYAMIIGGRAWEKRVDIANHVDDLGQIKDLIKYLRSGGRVIIMADVFNDENNCPVVFMGKRCNASLFPLRLAAATGSRLITVVPQFINDSIQIAFGPQFRYNSPVSYHAIMQDILTHFETEITKNPSVWLKLIRNTSSGKVFNKKSSKDITASSIELLNVERTASLH